MDAQQRPIRRVLLTGDIEHPDFASLRLCFAARENVELAETSTLGPPAGSYDILAVCQSRPGQFTQADVEQWHARTPLASLLAVLGSWCEGELRSGRPWHGVERVYWYDAIARVSTLLASQANSPAFRTYTIAERIEQSVACGRAASAGTTAAIFAQRRSEYEPLADVCRVLNISPRWERTWQAVGDAPDLLLVPLDDLQGAVSIEVLAGLTTAWPGSRSIALLNFPRRSEVSLLEEVGFHHVLGKPLLVADLVGCLEGLLVHNRAPQRRITAS